MAKKGGKKDEHQMLFDLQSGKRRVVVKVVYAILALLMGLSLLLIAGPLPFGDIFGGEDATELAREQAEEKQERIEAKLRQDPDDPALLLTLTRAHVTAGSQLTEVGPNGEVGITTESRQQYEEAASTWEEYLEATDEPSPNLAGQMAGTLLTLAQVSEGGSEALANIDAWAEAQRIVAKERPSLGSLSTLALYLPFTADYAGARKAAAEAKKFTTSKFQREQLDNQLEESEKSGKEFQKQLKEEEELNKSAREAQEGQEGTEGTEGGGSFINPLNGAGGLSE